MTTRRTFLTRLTAAVFGTTAVLCRPDKLLAGFRRRGRTCSPPSYPCVPAPMGATPPMVRPRIRGQDGEVSVSYPPNPSDPTTPLTIPGGGDFCCWGSVAAGFQVQAVEFTNSSGNPLPNQPAQPIDITGFMGNDWGFINADYSNQTEFYLQYVYVNSNNPNTQLTTPVYGPYATGTGG